MANTPRFNPNNIYPNVKTYEERQRDASERELRRRARMPKYVYVWNVGLLGLSAAALVGIIHLAPSLLAGGAIAGVSFAFLLAIAWFLFTAAAVSSIMSRFYQLGYAGGRTMILLYVTFAPLLMLGLHSFVANVGAVWFWLLAFIVHICLAAFLTRLVVR